MRNDVSIIQESSNDYTWPNRFHFYIFYVVLSLLFPFTSFLSTSLPCSSSSFPLLFLSVFGVFVITKYGFYRHLGVFYPPEISNLTFGRPPFPSVDLSTLTCHSKNLSKTTHLSKTTLRLHSRGCAAAMILNA